MDLTNLTPTELKDLTAKTDDKDAVREIATHVGAIFSGNTGVSTLKEKINEIVDDQIEVEKTDIDAVPDVGALINDPVAKALASQIAAKEAEVDKDEDVHVAAPKANQYSTADMLEMDAAQVKDADLRRKVIRAQAMRMIRCRISNVDPNDNAIPATIVTCYSKYTGKVSKAIPHDDDFYENGYHIPKIIYDELLSRTFNARKEVKNRGQAGAVGIKKMKTVKQRKFVIEVLEPLTAAELKALASSQQARGALDPTK